MSYEMLCKEKVQCAYDDAFKAMLEAVPELKNNSFSVQYASMEALQSSTEQKVQGITALDSALLTTIPGAAARMGSFSLPALLTALIARGRLKMGSVTVNLFSLVPLLLNTVSKALQAQPMVANSEWLALFSVGTFLCSFLGSLNVSSSVELTPDSMTLYTSLSRDESCSPGKEYFTVSREAALARFEAAYPQIDVAAALQVLKEKQIVEQHDDVLIVKSKMTCSFHLDKKRSSAT